MDPLTAATTFATVVSLIAEFKSQRGATESADYARFMSWLDETKHEELAALLNQNIKTTIGVKALLSQDRHVFEERFVALDRSLVTIASKLEDFRDLAVALRPEARLSDQAVSILRQISDAGASKVIEAQTVSASGPILVMTGGSAGQINYTEPQFIEDDLNILTDLCLLRLDHTPRGGRVFSFTRAAADLLNAR